MEPQTNDTKDIAPDVIVQNTLEELTPKDPPLGDFNSQVTIIAKDIQSPNYKKDTTGWKLSSNGESEFNPVPTPEWTYYGKVTFASEALKTFSGLTVHDQWKLIYTLHNPGTGATQALRFGVRLNNISSGDYNTFRFHGTALTTFQNKSFINLYGDSANTFLDSVVGESVITGKHINGIKSIRNTVGGFGNGNDQAISGWLVNDSNNLTRIDIAHIDASETWNSESVLTGTVELWYRDTHA